MSGRAASPFRAVVVALLLYLAIVAVMWAHVWAVLPAVILATSGGLAFDYWWRKRR